MQRLQAAFGRLPPTVQGILWIMLSGLLFSFLNAGLRSTCRQW